MADSLSEYLTHTRRLLHDANKNYYPDADLADYINSARRHTATDTGALRSLYNVYLTAAQEKYVIGQACGALITAGGTGYGAPPTFTFGTSGTGTTTLTAGVVTGYTITNPDSGLTASSYAAVLSSGAAAITVYAIPVNVVDIVNITLLWGNTRIQLKQYAFSDFSAYFRPWVQYQSIPGAWSAYGPQGFYLGPTPNIQYQAEFDTSTIPADLVLGGSGPMVQPATESVKYYAAYLAYTYAQQDDKANRMLQLYQNSVMWAINVFTRRGQGAYDANANVF